MRGRALPAHRRQRGYGGDAPRRLREADLAPPRLLPEPEPSRHDRGGRLRGAGGGGHPLGDPTGGGSMILLKSPREREHMRAAGKILAGVKAPLAALADPGIPTTD